MIPDANWLAQTHAACFADTRNWSAAEFEQLLQANGTCLARSPKGFALARQVLDEAEILTIAVLPDVRTRGVGRTLLSEIEQKLTVLGATTVFLEVSETNTAALALYYRANYRETGRRSGYYLQADGSVQDALILSKRITGGQ